MLHNYIKIFLNIKLFKEPSIGARSMVFFDCLFRLNHCENLKQKEDKQMQYIEKNGGYTIAQEFFYGTK